MKKYLYLVLLCFLTLFLGCKKDQQTLRKILIRIKNTSLVDYVSVTIYGGTSLGNSEGKKVISIKSGDISEYLGFESLADPVSYDIKVTNNLSVGIFSGDPNNPKNLSSGNYTLELFVPNRGDIKPISKLIKE
jgi:hypothetical protein